jgi:hypothetical protein
LLNDLAEWLSGIVSACEELMEREIESRQGGSFLSKKKFGDGTFELFVVAKFDAKDRRDRLPLPQITKRIFSSKKSFGSRPRSL